MGVPLGWVCKLCGYFNSLMVDLCSVCGADKQGNKS